MKSKARYLLTSGLLAVLTVTVASAATEEDASSATAKSIIEPFLKVDAASKYKMTTKHYQGIYKNARFLAETFSKEWYAVKTYDEVRTYPSKNAAEETIMVKLTLEWAFEGYEGEQTCHFKLQKDPKEWRVDWVLC